LSPRDVIEKQLKKAYELKNIDMFTGLLYSENEFRFYLEHDPDYLTGLKHININQSEKVKLDNLVEFTVADDSTYVYLTYNQEKDIHTKMFFEADQIVFVSFNINNVSYYTSLNNSGTYDTTEAIVYTDEAEFDMSADIFYQVFGNRKQRLQINKQVFFLKKNNEGLWKIRLWFEIGRKISFLEEIPRQRR